MPKGSKSAKAPKDKNAPKKSMSAYLLFLNERRPIVKSQAEHKDKKITELAKIIAAEWKLLTPEQKQPYEDKAKVAKDEYKEKLVEYQKSDNYKEHQDRLKKHKQAKDEENNSDDEEEEDSGKKGKGKKRGGKQPKDDKAPKRPQTSYFLYMNERRSKLQEQYPDKKLTEISKMAGDEWKNMHDDDKKPYAEKFKQAKEKYDEDLKNYKKTDDYKNYQVKLEKWKKDGDQKNKNNNNNKNKKGKKMEVQEEASESESGSGSDDNNNNNNDDDDEEEESEEENDNKKSNAKQSNKKQQESESDNENESEESDDED